MLPKMNYVRFLGSELFLVIVFPITLGTVLLRVYCFTMNGPTLLELSDTGQRLPSYCWNIAKVQKLLFIPLQQSLELFAPKGLLQT